MEKKTPAKELKKSVKPSEKKKIATVNMKIPQSEPAHSSVVKENPASAATAAAAAKKPVKSTINPSPKPETKTSTAKPATKTTKTGKK